MKYFVFLLVVTLFSCAEEPKKEKKGPSKEDIEKGDQIQDDMFAPLDSMGVNTDSATI